MGKKIEPELKKRLALGRGFDALIPDVGIIENEFKGFRSCDINLVHPNRYQPRVQFSKEEMKQLYDSVKTHGIIQPLLVRKDEAGYELIAGERRLRAAKMVGLSEVPIIVKDITKTQLLEISIIENIQREDLNPMEEANAYYRLMTEFNLTQDEVAKRVGKSRPAITNFLRLRQLPDEIKENISEGIITMGHARALLGAETPARIRGIWRAVISKGLSVRQTEVLVKQVKSEKKLLKPPRPSSETIHFSDLAHELSRNFGTKVLINRRGKKGKIEIEFYSDKDLDRILGLFP